MTTEARNARLRELRRLQALANSSMIGDEQRATHRARFSEFQQQMKAIDEAAAATLRRHGIVVLGA